MLWAAFGTGAAVLIGVAVFYFTSLSSVQRTLGQIYCQIASKAVSQFENDFDRETIKISRIATDVLTTEVLIEVGEVYQGRDDVWIKNRQTTRARAWLESKTAKEKVKFLHNRLSRRLNLLAGLARVKIFRIAVYDINGLLIATSSLPEKGVAFEESWFQTAKKQNAHFLQTENFAIDGGQHLRLVTPVWGGINIVGYVVATYDLNVLASKVEKNGFGQTGEVFLVDNKGVPLLKIPRLFLVTGMSQKPKPENSIFYNDQTVPAYWVTIKEGDGMLSWDRLLCAAPLAEFNVHRVQFGLPEWSVIITQDPSESYAGLQKSLGTFAVVGSLGVLLSIAGAAIIAWHIASPLKELQAGVRRFAKGERDHPVKVVGNDEIGELAIEFNRMMRRVTASENELRTFAQGVETAADAVIMTDLDGVIYYANSGFQKITGYGADEVIGKTPAILRSDETKDGVYQEIWNALGKEKSWRGELSNKRKNGENYPVDLTISPVTGDDGKVIAYIGVHRDITLSHDYQDRLEREVYERTKEIRDTQGLTAMGRMASMVAHDLRNALSTVKMNLQILSGREKPNARPDEVEYWDMAQGQVSYMEAILSDMLSYARPDKLNCEWCDLLRVSNEALISETHKMKSSGITFACKVDDDLPKVFCDRAKILAVLRNLIGNAVQAMSSGGELKIDCRLSRGKKQKAVIIEVSDTGGGIKKENVADIFEPFFTTRTKGTGLGLAIVKRIIDQHGGHIKVDSDQGTGTSIRVTLKVDFNRSDHGSVVNH